MIFEFQRLIVNSFRGSGLTMTNFELQKEVLFERPEGSWRRSGEALGRLGGFPEVFLVPDAKSKKKLRFLTPCWTPCWSRKLRFLKLNFAKFSVPRGITKNMRFLIEFEAKNEVFLQSQNMQK